MFLASAQRPSSEEVVLWERLKFWERPIKVTRLYVEWKLMSIALKCGS